MKTIAIANQKGGVGKTTTINLGVCLSRLNRRALLIMCCHCAAGYKIIEWS